MTESDDGGTATGGLRGITEDTPGHAGTPGEAGSIDGVSAAGAAPETYDVSGNAGGTRDTGPGTETTAEVGGTTGRSGGLVKGAGEEGDDDLITGDRGGVTGPGDL